RPSAGRPSHRPAREQVDMEMVDGLSALVPRVHDDPVASVGDALLARDLGGADEELTEQERLLRAGVRERANVLDGDHQDVQGRLRIDVAERDDALVPVDDVPRDPALDDSAEQAVSGCAHALMLSEGAGPRNAWTGRPLAPVARGRWRSREASEGSCRVLPRRPFRSWRRPARPTRFLLPPARE